MYDERSDSPAEAHTSGMCADLGQVHFTFPYSILSHFLQVQYILSDKTGTLTKNVMKLRRCSVAGMLYGAPLTNKLNPEPVKLGQSGQSIEGRKDGSGRSVEKEGRTALSSFDSSFTDSTTMWTPLNALSR